MFTFFNKKQRINNKKNRFENLLEISAIKEDTELKAFVEREIKILEDKEKSITTTTRTARAIENDDLKDAILIHMEPGKLYNISELQKQIEELNNESCPRIASLMKQLMEEKAVERIEKERKVYWKSIIWG